MTLSQNDVIQLIQIIQGLEQRVEELESLINESREFLVSDSFPTDGFEGQVTLRTDQPGPNGGGTLYRYDGSGNVWIPVT